jgi:transcriptional regulator with XRE-family HTH domain
MRMTKRPSSDASRLLRSERFRREMTQQQFAELFGVTGATISNWERGRISRIACKFAEMMLAQRETENHSANSK